METKTRTRTRTRTSGLVVHASPNGEAKKGEREKLYEKYQKGTISREDLRKYVSFLTIEKRQPQTVTIRFGGRTLTLTKREYDTIYVPAYLNQNQYK